MLQGHIGADDILQNAQMQAYLHIKTFTLQGPDSFNRWLTTIAKRAFKQSYESIER